MVVLRRSQQLIRFSASKEMIYHEHQIAKAEREAAAKEQRRLMEEAFELKLKLMGLTKTQSSGITGG